MRASYSPVGRATGLTVLFAVWVAGLSAIVSTAPVKQSKPKCAKGSVTEMMTGCDTERPVSLSPEPHDWGFGLPPGRSGEIERGTAPYWK